MGDVGMHAVCFVLVHICEQMFCTQCGVYTQTYTHAHMDTCTEDLLLLLLPDAQLFISPSCWCHNSLLFHLLCFMTHPNTWLLNHKILRRLTLFSLILESLIFVSTWQKDNVPFCLFSKNFFLSLIHNSRCVRSWPIGQRLPGHSEGRDGTLPDQYQRHFL